MTTPHVRWWLLAFLVVLLAGLRQAAAQEPQLINGNRTLAGWLNSVTTTGTPNTYAASLTGLTAYRPKLRLTVTVHAPNTGAPTLNVNGIGSLPLQKWVNGTLVNLGTGDLATGQVIEVLYDTTRWQVLNLGGTTPTVTVQEADGSPSASNISTFVFPNASVAVNSGTATITFAAGGSVAWGSLTGTLSAQSDLLTALEDRELVSNKSTNVNLGTSDTLYPTQKAVKDYVDAAVVTAGGGDVVGVGNCISGSCLDGTSDGGTTVALYDGDSNKGTFQTTNLTVDRTYTLPNESGTVCTTGSVCSGYGNVSVTGGQTPLANQLAVWTDATHLQGLATTGGGSAVLATGPTLVAPTLGAALATSINRITLTAPATGATLTIADSKALTVFNTLNFTGTDTSTVAFGQGGTVAYTTVSQTLTTKTFDLANNTLTGTLAQFNTALQTVDFLSTGAGELNALTSKASLVDADVLVIEDSAAAYAKKKITVANLPGGGDVTGVGDCTAGACLDGTSDGGTQISLYDTNSHKGTFQTADLTADRVYTAPNANATLVIPDAGAATQFLTGITTGGVITKAQPVFGDMGGAISDAQVPDLNTLSTGLTTSRCVETDGTGRLTVASTTCGTVPGTRTLTIQGQSGRTTVTPSTAQDLTANRTWTVDVASNAALSVARLTNLTSDGLVTTGSGNGTLAVVAAAPAAVGLGNVTNAAQLTRGASDFSSGIAEKLAPIAADRVLIEDSTAGHAKKYAQLGNIPGASGSKHVVQDEGGSGLAPRTYLNCVGTGITCTDNAAGDATVLTVTAGEGGPDSAVMTGLYLHSAMGGL